MRTELIVVATALMLTTSVVIAAEPAELQPFAFLVGEWIASGSGQPGVGSGTAVFTRDLQDRVLLRKSYAEYPSVGDEPGNRHDDLMVIYVGPGGGVLADYYDSEGHLIRYMVHSPETGHAVFVSEAVGSEPRFRLSYTLTPDGTLDGEFEIAPPGTPEAFKSYLTWHSRKATGPAK